MTTIPQQEERFRRTFENAPVGIANLGPDAEIVAANERFASLLGYTSDELVGRRFALLVHPDEVRDAEARLAAFVEGMRSTMEHERRLIARDGRTVRVRLTLTPVFGEDGALEEVIALVTDVAQPRFASERVALQARLMDTVEQAVFATDRQGALIYWNRHAETLFGWREEEVRGQLVLDITSTPSDRPAAEEMMRRLARGESWTGETTLRRRDGTTFAAWFVAAPTHDAAGALTGTVAIAHDISEVKRSEGVGRLVATVAHEFNNVLMGIAPFVEVIRRTTTRERIDASLAQIGLAIARGKRITGEILRFTQPAEPVRAAIDAGALLRDVAAVGRTLLPAACVLDVGAEEGLIIDGDAGQLQQTLTQLIVNARDAMPGGGTLSIRASREKPGDRFAFGPVEHPERFIHLAVQDTGTGMTAETRRHIFEPLFTTKKSGTGLGLPLAQQIVTRHGGEIFVESVPGAGTTFHLFLPAAM